MHLRIFELHGHCVTVIRHHVIVPLNVILKVYVPVVPLEHFDITKSSKSPFCKITALNFMLWFLNAFRHGVLFSFVYFASMGIGCLNWRYLKLFSSYVHRVPVIFLLHVFFLLWLLFSSSLTQSVKFMGLHTYTFIRLFISSLHCFPGTFCGALSRFLSSVAHSLE